MNELLKELTPSLIAIAGILLTTLASWLGLQAKAYLASMESSQTDTKVRKIVESTVSYVEQVGKALGSAEKLELAKVTALKWLNEKGLVVSEVELNVLIESTVNNFYANYKVTDTVPVIVEGTPIVEVAKEEVK